MESGRSFHCRGRPHCRDTYPNQRPSYSHSRSPTNSYEQSVKHGRGRDRDPPVHSNRICSQHSARNDESTHHSHTQKQHTKSTDRSLHTDFYRCYNSPERDHHQTDSEQTTKDEDEFVMIKLMDIFDELRPEVIRASVNHPDNRTRPFDKGLLLERCLVDLRTLSTWRRMKSKRLSAAVRVPPLESSSSGVGESSRGDLIHNSPGGFSQLQKTTLIPELSDGLSRLSRTTVKPELQESAIYEDTNQASTQVDEQFSLESRSKRVRRESEESLALEQWPGTEENLPAIHEKAHEPSTCRNPSKMIKHDWEQVQDTGYGSTSRYGSHCKNSERYEKYPEGYNAHSHGGEHTEHKGKNQSSTVQKRARLCFMNGCNVRATHLKKHVIGRHLPVEAYKSGDLSISSRMCILEDLLMKVASNLGCKSLSKLLQKVIDLEYYPSTAKIYEITEADKEIINQFNEWLYRESLPDNPTISPPNMVACLIQWRVLALMINCVGESEFDIKSNSQQEVSVQLPLSE